VGIAIANRDDSKKPISLRNAAREDFNFASLRPWQLRQLQAVSAQPIADPEAGTRR